ncbi:MAG: hypothetical protein ABRQ29_02915 [Smithellaceae bacterium]
MGDRDFLCTMLRKYGLTLLLLEISVRPEELTVIKSASPVARQALSQKGGEAACKKYLFEVAAEYAQSHYRFASYV